MDYSSGTFHFVGVTEVESIPSMRASDDEVSYLEGEPFATRDLFGRADADLPGPQAFLVEVPRRGTTAAHFHTVDQFQLFFPSTGSWYQRHDVDSLMLHYVDAYVTYGPFGSRDHAFDFYTLRAQSSVDVAFMPRERQKLLRRGRRNEHISLKDKLGTVVDPKSHQIRPVLGPHNDGLAAYLLVAGANASVVPPLSRPNGGQYYCLLSGSIVMAGARYDARSVAWHDGDTAPNLHAADGGFEMLLLQFPTHSAVDMGLQ